MTSVLKPQAPFERLKLANHCPEIALNRAIILQAIIDASSMGNGISSKKIAREAYNWLFSDSEDFRKICLKADFLPHFVVKIAKQMIQLHGNSQTQKPFSTKYKEKLSKAQKVFRTKNIATS